MAEDLEGRVVCQAQHCQQVCVGLQSLFLQLTLQHMYQRQLVCSQLVVGNAPHCNAQAQ